MHNLSDITPVWCDVLHWMPMTNCNYCTLQILKLNEWMNEKWVNFTIGVLTYTALNELAPTSMLEIVVPVIFNPALCQNKSAEQQVSRQWWLTVPRTIMIKVIIALWLQLQCRETTTHPTEAATKYQLVSNSCFFLHGIHSPCSHKCVVLWGEHMRCPCVYWLCLACRVSFSIRASVQSLITISWHIPIF